MKKKRMKIIKLLVLPIILILSSCNTEEMYLKDKTSGNKNGIVSKYLTGQEAKKVADILKKELRDNGNSNLSSTKANSTHMRLNELEIDYNDILLVLDTLGVKNYTFKVINHPEDSEAIFHNLVLNEDEYNNRKLLMFKYENENQTLPFNQFQGTISKKGISDETNPCDNGTYDANFNIGLIVPGSGGGDATLPPGVGGGVIPPGGNPPNNPGSSGSGGGSGNVSDLPLEFSCNSCSFSAGSWEAFSSHRDGNGVIYPFTIILGRSSSTPITTVENPCDNGGSIGVINNINTTPCEELTKLISNTEQKQALQSLQEHTGSSHEYGFSITKNQTTGLFNTPNPAIANSDRPNEISMPVGSNNIGSFHTHPTDSDGWYPMFSDNDLNYLFFVALKHNNGSNAKNYSEYILTLTVTEGTFAIKIKDWAKFAAFRNNTTQWKENELSALRDSYDNREPEDNINLFKNDFLSLLKSLDAGVGLYEMNSDFTAWSEVSLNPNNPAGTPINNPCN